MPDNEELNGEGEDEEGYVCGVCDDCGTGPEDLSYCATCNDIFCPEGWEKAERHNPSKKKGKLRRASTAHNETKFAVHEKTKLSTFTLVEEAFSNPPDDAEMETWLAKDAEAAWFGVSRDKSDEKEPQPLIFHDHGRFAEMMADTAQSSVFIRQMITQLDTPAMPTRRTPSLVSFVGQSGMGKSSLIKVLILLKTPVGVGAPHCPVAGRPGSDLPTSEDVHLYLDPATFLSEAPILYADSEGLGGGERQPLATASRARRDSHATDEFSDDDSLSFQNRFSSRREIQWAETAEQRTRSFAASRFYPRLLFTFSDTVVFVHKNSREIETVVEQLIEWAAKALETTNNQPILPYAIIVLNECSPETDLDLWDVDISTKRLLESLADTVNQNATFARYAEGWRKRQRQVKDIRELMLYYYSDVKVVRIPRNTQPNRILEQVQKLHAEIERGCKLARERKSELRMLLDANEFQSYLGYAFDHYARDLKIPFDFVQASFLHNPIPLNFGGNILKLVITMANKEKAVDRSQAIAIFNRLGKLVASCMMLEIVRHNIPGTASHIFPQQEYLDHLDYALKDFCLRGWRCEYVRHGDTATTEQYGLSTNVSWNTVRPQTTETRCVNVSLGHDARGKGHQDKYGRIFAHGPYISDFSFKNNRKEFHDGIYLHLVHLLNQLDEEVRQGESKEAAAAKMHRKSLQDFFYRSSSKGRMIVPRNYDACWCCLFEAPEHILPCGHVLCTPCLKAYGEDNTRTVVRIHECPFESPGRGQPRLIYIKPETVGARVLVLDDGGVRSVIQVEILRRLEQELGGKIPVQIFFDLIVGKGSGSIIALNLLESSGSLDTCKNNLERIFKKSLAPKNRRRTSKLKVSTHKYRADALEKTLREVFTENKALFGAGIDERIGAIPKIAIPVTSSKGKTILLTNYVRRNDMKLANPTYSPEVQGNELEILKELEVLEEFKFWEAARAATAHPSLFKPFKSKSSNQAYSNQVDDSDLLAIADSEFKTIFGSSLSEFPEIVVSLGTGLSIGQVASPTGLMRRNKTWESAKSSLIGKSKQKTQRKLDQECQKAWNEYMQSLEKRGASEETKIRLNIDAVDLPAFDDIDKVESLRDMVQTQIRSIDIRLLAARLIARLFYFERSGEPELVSGNEMFIRGEILCRIPDKTPVLSELGKLLRHGKLEATQFIIHEQLSEQQYFNFPLDAIDCMIHNRKFWMPQSKIRISKRAAEFKIMLQFANNDEYLISGFPRHLVGKEAHVTKNHRDSISSPTGISPRPVWTPPSPSLHSFSFDSGVHLNDRRSSSILSSPKTEASISRRASTPPPQELEAPDPRNRLYAKELDAPDPRDRRVVRDAMRQQRERDQYSNQSQMLALGMEEEVVSLEERLRRIENDQRTREELASLEEIVGRIEERIAGIRKSESNRIQQPAGRGSGSRSAGWGFEGDPGVGSSRGLDSRR